MKKYYRILISALLIASGGFSSFDAVAKSVKAERNLIKEGNKAFADSNFVEAFALYEQALVENPSSDAALFNKAVTLTHMANEDNRGTANDPRVKAAEIFESLARTSNDDVLVEKSFYNLGNMAFREGDYAGAIDQYKGALRKNPDNLKTRQNLRIAQLQQQEQEQNQDQNQEQQQEQNQEQQQQEQEQEQEQNQDQQQQQQQQMTQSAAQIQQ
ncbi:MAG: tetratricopeptide repeat protein, partial [Muribaculaceae bacterium]|nr:tetratricopeptide repeat protein [Muribaculaceae bacterium]